MLLAGCGGDDKAAQPPAPPPAKVVVETVGTADVPILREFVARTEAKEEVVIQARVEAILAKRLFEEGRRVDKDQLLFELDPQTFAANLRTAEANLAKANADLKLAREQVSVRAAEAALTQAEAALRKAEQDVARLRPLAEEDAVPRQDLDTALATEEVAIAEVAAQKANLENSKIQEAVGIKLAEAQLESAKAAMVLAELELSYCTISSPIDGLIGRARVSVGNLVGRGEATELATVSLIDPMWVTFAISEAEYLYLRRKAEEEGREEGDVPLDLILADDSTFAHNGKVITAEREVAIETGTLQLVAEFPNPEGELRPGQFGRVRSTVGKIEDAVLVPQRAVTEQQGVKAVLVVGEGNKVRLQTIQVSERHERYFVVAEGLEGGETVIVEGLQKARPGSVVDPTTEAASSEAGDDDAKRDDSGE
jgi:membrane fusion protein (multidrug efflux system)